jgi:nicotinate-nucleotide adenylyltransferase
VFQPDPKSSASYADSRKAASSGRWRCPFRETAYILKEESHAHFSLEGTMRLGVFGGTFDPVHTGHLILAEQCREQGRLDQVLFVPAARPPHKQETLPTSFHQRVEMLELAIAGHPAFRIDELEGDRPGPSYTVHTLEALHRKHAGSEFFLLLGSDTLHDLKHWYQPERIAELAGFLVVLRPDWPAFSEGELAVTLKLPNQALLPFQLVETPLIDISSRDIRRRIAEGRSVRYLMPRGVEAYIDDKQLYRKNDTATGGNPLDRSSPASY